MFIGKFENKGVFPQKYLSKTYGHIIYDESCSVYKNKKVEIYFWGVLYNKKVLGYTSDQSDAEVISELYEIYGLKGLAKADGSYTLMIQEGRDILIARDHHGTSKPVYYTDRYFASSLSLLQETDGFITEPDFQALSRFLNIGYIATPFSAVKGVHKLGGGEILIYKEGKQKVENLYCTDDIMPVLSDGDLNELAEEYGRLHIKAIKKRIDNKQDVGILLSGGYDSGCNLAALRNIYAGNIRSFSIGFKGDNWTELPLARCMSDTFGTIHTEYEIDGSELSGLPDIVAHLGDPFVEGGLMVNYAAMKLIGDNKPEIILGGDGSDQYFGTSGREVALHYLISKYKMAPLMQLVYRLLCQSGFDKNNYFYRVRFHLDKVLNILQGDLFGFPDFRLKEMLQEKSFLSTPDTIEPDIRSFEHLYVQHAYKTDLEKIINQVILFKATRMAEMFDNRITFPYMDLDLYQFLQKLPVKYKCKGGNVTDIAKGHATAKYLLKYHYKPMLPEVITSKKKQGGFAPMPLFFKNDLQRSKVADYLMNSSMFDTFLDRNVVEVFIRQYDKEVHEDGNWFWYKQNKAIQYFNLLTLAIWWERFVKGEDNKNVLK